VEEVPEDHRTGILGGKTWARDCSSLDSEHDHQRNNKLVWDETTRIMTDLFDNVWGDRSEIVVDHCLHVTLPVYYLIFTLISILKDLFQIALFVIGVAGSLRLVLANLDSRKGTQGFGRRMTWTSDLDVPPGHQMTFKDALRILSNNLFLRIILPDWAMNLTKHSRNVRQAFIELKVCLATPSIYTCIIDVRTAIHAGNGGSS
jgi:hypothetical protein